MLTLRVFKAKVNKNQTTPPCTVGQLVRLPLCKHCTLFDYPEVFLLHGQFYSDQKTKGVRNRLSTSEAKTYEVR